MSKPLTENATQPIAFEERVQLVKAEVQARVSAYPAEQQNGTRARLWTSWIRKNVLTHTAKAAKQTKPFNCDLYPNRQPEVSA